MYKGKNVIVVVLAGGSGSRFGGDMPKQFQMLGGMPVFMHSTCKFDGMDIVDHIVLVAPQDYLSHCQDLVARHGMAKVTATVGGGKSRQESTYNGLCTLDVDADSIVLVHDAARPFVCENDTARLVAATNAHGAAVLALPVTDTIKVADDAQMAIRTIDRRNLYASKTPQAARMADLFSAHEKARRDGFEATDDCQLMEFMGIYSKIVITDVANIKITTQVDLDFAAFLLEREMT